MCNERVIQMLTEMIRIDSRNTHPMEYSGVREATEQAMGDYVRGRLEAGGFAVEEHPIAPGRPNLVGVRCGRREWPWLAFEAHLDTVGVDGMKIAPFDPQIRDGRMYGRGSCDTKGSMAAMLEACLSAVQEELPVNLLFLACSSEETGCEGAKYLDLSRWPVEGIIVGEPTSCQPITAHKAHLTLELVCRGRAAHGSCPEAGDNAILKGARLIRYLQEIIVPELDAHPGHRFSRSSTLSIGMVRGGVKVNIVPERCSIWCDFRLVPQSPQAPAEFARSLVSRASRDLGFPVEAGYVHLSPALYLADSHPLLQRVTEAQAVMSEPSCPGAVAYCTDGGVLGERGYPCLILGPGDILQAHGAVEYLELSQLSLASRLYLQIVRETARRGLR